VDRVNGRSYFEIKVLAAFSGAVLVVVLLAATAWKVSREAIDVGYQVSHTHYVLNSPCPREVGHSVYGEIENRPWLTEFLPS